MIRFSPPLPKQLCSEEWPRLGEAAPKDVEQDHGGAHNDIKAGKDVLPARPAPGIHTHVTHYVSYPEVCVLL